MICPNCNTEIGNNLPSCPNCKVTFNYNTNSNDIPTQNIVENNKKKKSKAPLVIGIIVAFIFLCIVIGVKSYKAILKYLQNININEATNVKLNSLEKLKMDYDKGIIDINDYFKNLVYLEYAPEYLDSKYESDYEFAISGCQLDTMDILDEHFDELDKDVVEFYLKNESLSNVKLTSDSVTNTVNSTNNQEKIEVLSNDDGKVSRIVEHTLNKVYLTPNNKFLIWYTDTGVDAITSEQLNKVSTWLEESVSDYEKSFGLKYSYTPYIDNKIFSSDWKNTKKILQANNISPDVLKTAMSVFVYDLKNDIKLGQYTDEGKGKKIINRSLLFDFMDKDEVMAYPYILINQKTINNKETEEICKHELFHHFQYNFYESLGYIRRSIEDETIIEGSANLASALSSKTPGTDNYLNNWANIYTAKTSEQLFDITDNNNSRGYALYLYFYSFINNVDSGTNIMLTASVQKNQRQYLNQVTPKGQLINAINDLAYKIISKDYDKDTFKATVSIKFKDTLASNKKLDLKINPGAIDYFELPISNVSVDINNDFVSIMVYGYKNGKYEKILLSNKSIDIKKTQLTGYDKYYLIITNGDLENSYNYKINMGNTESNSSESSMGTIKNYNIEIALSTKVGGIEVEQYSKGVVDEVHQTEYLESKTTTMGVSIDSELYQDFKTGYSYMSQPYSDKWIKQKNGTNHFNLEEILTKLKSMENVTKINDNHYKIKMTKKEISNLIGNGSSNSYSVKGDAYIDVYVENEYITELKYDFSKMISGYDTFNSTIKFANYNNAGDVNIPSDVLSNAE